MCRNDQHPGPTVVTPTITRIPLTRVASPHRWSRRRLLIDTGLGTAGVAILAACGSGSGGGSANSTRPPTAPPDTSSTETADAPAETSAPRDTDAVADEEAPTEANGSELQLQHVSLGFVSAYVLVRGNEAAIVDTGTEGSGQAIDDALAATGLAPADVRHIVLTHNHGDHIGGLGELEGAMTNATVYAGSGDIDSIRSSLDLAEVADGDEVFGLGVVATPGHTPGEHLGVRRRDGARGRRRRDQR